MKSLTLRAVNVYPFKRLTDRWHSCQPFRFWRNSSAFYTIFRHSDRNDQIPPKLKKFSNSMIRTTHVQGAAACILSIYFKVFFPDASRLALTPIFSSSAACNGACDWQACGSWPMSSLYTNALLLFLLDAGEYNIISLRLDQNSAADEHEESSVVLL